MIAQGNHKVKLTDAFVGESKEKKTPFIGFEFTLEDNAVIYHSHYLSEKEFTDKASGKPTTMAKEGIKLLRKLGFIGNSLADLADGLEKFTAIDSKINIVVEHEEFTKEDGSSGTSAKVKFVNVGYGGPERMDKKQAVVKFKGHSFDNYLAGVEKVKVKETPEEESTETPEGFDDGDVPF